MSLKDRIEKNTAMELQTSLYGASVSSGKVAKRSSTRLLDSTLGRKALQCILAMESALCLAALSGQSSQPAGARR
jgi:hypothetical protein